MLLTKNSLINFLQNCSPLISHESPKTDIQKYENEHSPNACHLNNAKNGRRKEEEKKTKLNHKSNHFHQVKQFNRFDKIIKLTAPEWTEQKETSENETHNNHYPRSSSTHTHTHRCTITIHKQELSCWLLYFKKIIFCLLNDYICHLFHCLGCANYMDWMMLVKRQLCTNIRIHQEDE